MGDRSFGEDGRLPRIPSLAGLTSTHNPCRLPTHMQVFYGLGTVRLQSSEATPEFWVAPEWWGASSGDSSSVFDAVGRSCAGARCMVVLSKSYGLGRPWKVNAQLLPW